MAEVVAPTLTRHRVRRRSIARYPSLHGSGARHRRLRSGLERGGEPACRPGRARGDHARGRRAGDRRRLDRRDRRGGPRRAARPSSRSARTGACGPGSRPGIAKPRSVATRSAGASTPTGSIRRRSSSACWSSSAADACDVAVGSRFAAGDGYDEERYVPSPSRRFGIGLLQKAMHLRLGRPFHDPTSGMAAVNARRCP